MRRRPADRSAYGDESYDGSYDGVAEAAAGFFPDSQRSAGDAESDYPDDPYPEPAGYEAEAAGYPAAGGYPGRIREPDTWTDAPEYGEPAYPGMPGHPGPGLSAGYGEFTDDSEPARHDARTAYGERTGYGEPGGDGYPAGYGERDGYRERAGYEAAGYGERDGYEERDGYRERAGYDERDGYRKRDGYDDRDGYRERDGYRDSAGYDDRDGYREPAGYGETVGFAGPGAHDGSPGYGEPRHYPLPAEPEPAGFGEPAGNAADPVGYADRAGYRRARRRPAPGYRDEPHADDPAPGATPLGGSFFDPSHDDDLAEPRGRGRRRRGRWRRRFGTALALVVIAGLVVGIVYGGERILARFGEVPDYPGEGTGAVTVQVNPGDTASDIAATLTAAGVVKSERAFREAATDDPRSTGIQPGYYRVRKQMSGVAALALLLDPASKVQTRFTVPEGLTVAATLKLIASKTRRPLADLQKAARDTKSIGLPDYARGRLEGFLFPATYEIDPGTRTSDILREMVATYRQNVDDSGLSRRAGEVGLSAYEMLIVASLIERETRLESERPKVARVIYNRLELDWFLGIDAAVLYGLGRPDGALSQADLAKVTPYNTRKVKGLPPTPIANPGMASIEGALKPASGPWIYYVLQDRSGRHLFTDSVTEFEEAVARCRAAGLC